MNKLSLSFACWDYDRVQALIDGSVRPNGIDLTFLKMPVEETFFRMMRHQEFDVSELSASSYLLAKDRGYPNFTAIPVFPSRFFRHSGIYVNAHSGIQKPADLRGKRVGVPEYQLTACVWIRGFLQNEYGVPASDIHWFSGGQETPGRIEKVKLDLPPDIRITPIAPHQTLNQMLEEGELDAFIAPRAPSCFLNGSPNVKRLFEDYASVEKDYFRKTGIFPIMHVVAIRDEVLEKHPWIAANLYQAFVEAKNKVYEGFNQTAALKATLPWLVPEIENTKKLMGDDFWPYGLEKNRTTLEALVQYSYEQGLIKNKLNVEDLFVKSSLEQYTI
ncbi:ABC transporter substrate-binding protein [Paenibacillus alginolyticus]|uniref:ABC transporter substrate-binding protein n=1 Tax=Paenibacillus alginolyticus TaxID=59839 RepID=A0ABT4G8Z9_9BACL|nr:PhnD/SsuA/transferrin family substrate-binding protein [Paenibacillus alginolyticus]MCY9666810.1 ABC transporter substrate-binding protein [Paenibacillus alginolyticus]MCY9692662.1 ABC transporter substrate-binding protein [Paenibacillus alginolyticus]MEC0148749.1 ABC transporter substrate-binding protein [Paenibacillus alginolyticus]